MKKSLSVILSLVLLVSSLAIPMSVSAVSEINPEQLISGIKTAATNLQIKEDQKQQLFVPLGIFSNNSTYSGTKDNAITLDDDKKVVGSKVIKIPNEFGTNSDFWGMPSGTDAVVSYQPVSNTTDTSSAGAVISIADIKSVSFAVKTNKPISFILKIHSGGGFNTSKTVSIAAGDEWQTLNWNISTDFTGDQTNIGSIFVLVNDENTNQKSFGDGAEVYFGSMFFETTETDANIKEVTDVSGNDISDLADCIVKAEKIDTSVYTDDTVTVLKTAITDAKKALIAYYVEINDINSLVSFVNNEIKILSKTEILLIGNIARYYKDSALVGTENAIFVPSENTETNNGHTTKNYYPAADDNWRYLSGDLALLAYVSPDVSVDDYKSDNFGDGFKTADYDDIYLYLVDNSFKSNMFNNSNFLNQFGFLSGHSSWVNSGGNGFSTAAILSGLDSGNYTKIFANKTKIPIKTNDTYITGLYDNNCTVKGLQILKSGGFTDGSEIAFSPLYGVKYCKEEVAVQTSIAEVLTAVNSIDVNDWDNGSIIEDTSKAIKEASSANLEDLKAILVSQLEDAGTVEEVWYPKWVKNSTDFSSTENVYRPTDGATGDQIIDNNVANFGSYVAKLDSTHKILSITAGNTNEMGDNGTPIKVEDYSDMWMYVYNNTERAVAPDQFIVAATGNSSTSPNASLSFPAKQLYRIEIDDVLKAANDAQANVNGWDTNRLQLKNSDLTDNEAVYYGTVFGLKKIDITELRNAETLSDIFEFYDQNVKDKGLENAEDAISTFEAFRNAIIESGNFDNIQELLLYELGKVGTVEEVWKPQYRKPSGTDFVSADDESANVAKLIPNYNSELGSFVAKIENGYTHVSIVRDGTDQNGGDNPIEVTEYVDMWMYVYNNTDNAVTPSQFMVVSTASAHHSITNLSFPAKELYRIEIDEVLKAANDAKASENGWNTNRLQFGIPSPANGEVYFGTVFGGKKIDTSELVNATKMVDIIEFYDKYIDGKSLVDANGDASTEIADFVNSIKGDFISINATLNDDTFVTPTADCDYSLDYAKLGEEFKFKVEVKNGGSVNSVTYDGETKTPVEGVYTITVDDAKTLEITTDRDGYAPVGGMLTVDSGYQRNIIDHSTANNHPTWSQNKDTLNGGTEKVVYQEPVLFYTDGGQVRSNVKLMYPVENIVAVTSYTTINGEFVKYYKGTDFTVGNDGKISLTAESSIPHDIELEEIKNGIGDSDIWNSAGTWNTELPKNQVLVTYTYTKTWDGVDYSVPTYANSISTAYQKLNTENSLNVLFIGDSITTGCNTSGQDGVFYTYTADGVGDPSEIKGWSKYLGLSSSLKPDWVNDSWDKQVVANLEKAYPGATITWDNRAVGSSDSQWYYSHIDELLVSGELGDVNLANTDLVFIGFGMNESSESKDEHKERIENLIKYLRNKNSNVSIVLVSAFYPTFWNSSNSTWNNYNLGIYEELYFELAEKYENIAVAPVNTAFTNVLNAKEGVDYIANGINHPNDFGANLYADTITSTLINSATVTAPKALELLTNGIVDGTGNSAGKQTTAIYLLAEYDTPMYAGGKTANPKKIILDDGNVADVVSRTFYVASKSVYDNLADKDKDNFGKTEVDGVKQVTLTGQDLAKYWKKYPIDGTNNATISFGVGVKNITENQKDNAFAVRAKVEYCLGNDGYVHTVYSDVQTADNFSAQGAYDVLESQGKQPSLWFGTN